MYPQNWEHEIQITMILICILAHLYLLLLHICIMYNVVCAIIKFSCDLKWLLSKYNFVSSNSKLFKVFGGLLELETSN